MALQNLFTFRKVRQKKEDDRLKLTMMITVMAIVTILRYDICSLEVLLYISQMDRFTILLNLDEFRWKNNVKEDSRKPFHQNLQPEGIVFTLTLVQPGWCSLIKP